MQSPEQILSVTEYQISREEEKIKRYDAQLKKLRYPKKTSYKIRESVKKKRSDLAQKIKNSRKTLTELYYHAETLKKHVEGDPVASPQKCLETLDKLDDTRLFQLLYTINLNMKPVEEDRYTLEVVKKEIRDTDLTGTAKHDKLLDIITDFC